MYRINQNVQFGLIIILCGLLAACTGTLRPMHTERAVPGTLSKSSPVLVSIPEPEDQVVAAVYRFRDQTGQYKASDRVASWSTAVTQGATSILIKSMEDSGWFVPIEREGISNLLNERQIIQQIRQQHAQPDQRPSPLPPLLFAGVMLEGGIIGYDTNVITGGAGARYLGIGGSAQYRKDQVTIYLRAVSTQSGRVLKTVHTTKSIISQKLDSGVFRFIDTDRLLEAEAGYTYNEPPVMAVTEAIDEAVQLLILEGIEDGIWHARNEEEVTAFREQFDYEKKMQEQLQRDYFGFLEQRNLRQGWTISPAFSLGSFIGNYNNPDIHPGVSLQIERNLTHMLSVKANLQRTSIGAGNAFRQEDLSTADLLVNVYITPHYSMSPYFSAGGGILAFDRKFDFLENQIFPAVTFEGGLDYRFNEFLGLRLYTNYRYLLIDGLDGIAYGEYNDQHWNINAGITISF
jgi:curli production assembly/transport component CsgG